MKITVPKRDLLAALSVATRIADPKSTIPMLGHARLTASGSLTVAATDLYLAYQTRLTCDAPEHGSICLPARDLLERVKVMPDGPVVITTDDKATATLKSGTSQRKFKLHGLPGDSFPPLPEPGSQAPRVLSGSVLTRLINATEYSISPDTTRAPLNSGLLELDGDVARLITTDGRRLTVATAKLENAIGTDSLLIPAKGIAAMRKLCDGAELVSLQHSGANVFLTAGDQTLAVKLTDAQFPAYQQVIPQENATRITAPRVALIDAVRSVALSADERAGCVRIGATAGTLAVQTENETGEAADELPADLQGPELTIGVNARYIVESLSVVDTDEVVLQANGELDPIVVTPAGEDGVLAVVMPMRI